MLARIILLAVCTELGALVQASQGSVCSSGIYPALTALRSDPVVVDYCNAHYPVKPVTIFKRKVECRKKRPSTEPPATTSKPTISHSTTSTTSTKPNELSSLLSLAPKIVSTACSCIQGNIVYHHENLVLYHRNRYYDTDNLIFHHDNFVLFYDNPIFFYNNFILFHNFHHLHYTSPNNNVKHEHQQHHYFHQHNHKRSPCAHRSRSALQP
ncbi:hypothetical protein SCUP234_06523 [Seiridium cupressi]